MAEKYEKSTTEIAAGCILSLITMYNSLTTVLTSAPKWKDEIIHRDEINEDRNRTHTLPQYSPYERAQQQLEDSLQLSESKLKKTIEINPTPVNIFATLVKKTP